MPQRPARCHDRTPSKRAACTRRSERRWPGRDTATATAPTGTDLHFVRGRCGRLLDHLLYRIGCLAGDVSPGGRERCIGLGYWFYRGQPGAQASFKPAAARGRVVRVQTVWRKVRRRLNFYLVKLEMKIGRERLWSFPYELAIDVTNKCNLHCSYCPTGRGEQGGRGRGSMDLATFRDIIDELGPYAYRVELFNWGEPLFAKDLPEMVAYAEARGVRTIVSSNLSFPLAEDRLRDLVDAGLSYLTAAIDGVDQSSYETYRRGGRFELALNNLRRFVEYKRASGRANPHITWQYLVFAHNEPYVETARAMASEMGVDCFSAIGGLHDDPAWAPSKAYSFDYLQVRGNRCVWLWQKAVFHWDGGFASCCAGFHKKDDFDAYQRGTFRRMWNNEKFRTARRIWTRPESPLPEGHFCSDCDKVRLFRGLPLRSGPASVEREAARGGARR